MKYKVESLINDTYQVYQMSAGTEWVVFQGSLADCEAFIRLKEGGYL